MAAATLYDCRVWLWLQPHALWSRACPPPISYQNACAPPAATSKDEAMAVLDEEDLDAVGGGWGEEDEMVGPGDNDADAEAGPRGEGDGLGGSEGDEEGGWEMEVGCGGFRWFARVLGAAFKKHSKGD